MKAIFINKENPTHKDMIKMKNIFLVSILSSTLIACSSFPLKTDIKENHFKLDNFKSPDKRQAESIALMCYKQRPSHVPPGQFLSGQHNLWAVAKVSQKNIPNSVKEAYVNFNVNLSSGVSYTFNREIDEDKISIWIQEADSGLIVSNVITSELRSPLVNDTLLRKKQCKSSSI